MRAGVWEELSIDESRGVGGVKDLEQGCGRS